jgi:small subunit ribosomal protein S16
MVKIRLRRVGAKKQPHYRIVVADSRSPRDGKSVETIGHYNPRTDPPTVEVDAERALYWLGTGAQPSEAVRQMLDRLGILARAAAIKRGEVLAETSPAAADAATEALKETKARKGSTAEAEALKAELLGVLPGAKPSGAWEEGELGASEAGEAEEEEALEEEEDEFEEDLFEEDEELDEIEDWEPEAVVTDEAEDFEDDWEEDIDEDDDVDDDPAYEEDDE